jgi:hypothetical protein
MKYVFLFTCLMSLAVAPNLVHSQTTKPPIKTTTRKEKPSAEADRIAKARRAQAISLLLTLANDAASFDDLAFRSRTLARIADLLWDVDSSQARALFVRAWDAINLMDPKSGNLPTVRDEVLRLAGTHDQRLAEKFLDDGAKHADEKSQATADNWWSLPDALEQRLNVAENLLAAGDTKRAVELAEPLLNNVTISTLEFLSSLRGSDAATADRLYANMLNVASQQTPLDPHRLSLLSSYLFTPNAYVTPVGSSWPATPSSPPNVDPALRLRFFEVAASALIQPVTEAQPELTDTQTMSRYLVAKRLFPMFESYAPSSLTASLRAQIDVLDNVVGDAARAREKESREQGNDIVSEQQDSEQSLLDQVERAKTSKERDNLYLKLALLSIQKDDGKARDYVDKIDDTDLRKQVRAWVDWQLIVRAIEQKKFERALYLERTGELSHIQRTRIFTQIATLNTQSDREQTLMLINKAADEVARIDNSDKDRPRGLFAIANALCVIEPARAWEIAFDAVKAANSVEKFTGEDSHVTTSLNNGGTILMGVAVIPEFQVSGLFTKLSTADLDRTIDLAHGFQDVHPRAVATIAIATAVLKDQSRAEQSKQIQTKK